MTSLSNPRRLLTREQLDALIDAALRVQVDNELAPRRPLGAFLDPLDALLEVAKLAYAGVDPQVGVALQAGWRELVEAVRAEVE